MRNQSTFRPADSTSQWSLDWREPTQKWRADTEMKERTTKEKREKERREGEGQGAGVIPGETNQFHPV